MADYKFFQIDAFAERPMAGGPAGVMPMEAFPAAEAMQAIAAENNLAETAFIVAKGKGVWDLRWFTPAVEVPLCGHATLASAHAIFTHLKFDGPEIGFDTKSGRLTVKRLADGRLEMDFPADMPKRIDAPPTLAEALGAEPKEVWGGQYLLAVFENAEQIRALKPDMCEDRQRSAASGWMCAARRREKAGMTWSRASLRRRMAFRKIRRRDRRTA